MQFGPYIIRQELARGGQGAVYLAHHQSLQTPVAIKVLLDDDPRSIKRFKQEARILAKLNHPNLLQVVDLGDVNGRPYLAMEYIQGSDLKNLYRQQGAPDLDWIQDTFGTLSEVLDYIHGHGIIHRDIKPANIFLEADTNRIILVDFGLVKRDKNAMSMGSLDQSRMSLSGEMAGTPAFMAPEQADPSFGEIGPWTDTYALGSTLYYLLTGQSPFDGTTAYNILVKLMRDEPLDPRQHRPDLSAPLAGFVMQCMRKDSMLRPQSGVEFMDLLNEALYPRPKSRRNVYKIGALILAISGFGALFHFLTDQGYTPREAEIIAEDIAESPDPSPVITTTATPTPSVTPIRTRSFDELVAEFKAIPRNDIDGKLAAANEIIEGYPEIPSGYLYRASTLYNRNKTETNPETRHQTRIQIDVDLTRAISLSDDPEERQHLTGLLNRFRAEVR